ncbi:hypothetical protein SLS53_007943 [Cytospora paraplurivora]|uniref:Alpha-galactosidase n=1 Tax=Cytospora paraplurivora TaxID=2898453 RepID=A0AAN9YDC1_9PEZI
MLWSALLGLSLTSNIVSATTVRTSTPVLGWNSYNYYSCYPNETIIKDNAAGLVSLGFHNAGYTYVTTDCGWTANYRDSSGRLVWNSTTFPSGGPALGDYLHDLGLKFGVYSGAGYYQCGSTDQPASLGHETTDADSISEWGADSLKAPKIGNSWRISNDIYDAWRSIWRITNQVVPYFKHTGVGAYADMDMIIVGLRALSLEEERFHFGMWAINKSPLVIGAPMDTSITPIASLEILNNTEVIALNQDSLGKQAQLVRRYTTEQYDIWAAELSGSRLVLGLANWYNGSQSVSMSLPADLGIASATARDVWAAQDLGTINNTYTTTLSGHELRLLVLSDIVNATVGTPQSIGYYTASTNATLSGAATVVSCSTGECLPAGSKVGNIGKGESAAAVTFSGVATNSAGTKLLGVDFINYDVALATAWEWGDNTRNLTVAVNEAGVNGTRFAFPISGGDWYDTGRLYVYVDGFVAGDGNEVIFTASGDDQWAPDLVGFEIYETD